MTDLWRFLSESSIEKLQKVYGRDFIDYNRFLLRGPFEKRKEEFRKFRYSVLEILDRLANKRGMLLDVGCGFGLQSIFFSELGYEVVLFDITKRKMEITSKLVKDFGGCCYPLIADACYLPIKDSSVDVIFMNEFISHVRNLTKTLKEMKRSLKVNGEIAISDGDKNSLVMRVFVLVRRGRSYKPKIRYGQFAERLFSPREVRYLFACYGFSSIVFFYSFLGSWLCRLMSLKLVRFVERNFKPLYSSSLISNLLGKYVVIGRKK